ncbi:MAG: hypothetical protein R3D33_07270 [Hyphomicrobiaceae bacterium]
MEGEAARKAERRRIAEQRRGLVLARAELAGEVVDRGPRLGEAEAHDDLGAGRLGPDDPGDLLQFLDRIDRKAPDAVLAERPLDLGTRLDGVVVVQDRVRGERAHPLDLLQRGDVEHADPRLVERADDRGRGVRFDRIGDLAGKAREKDLRTLGKGGGREAEHRAVGQRLRHHRGRIGKALALAVETQARAECGVAGGKMRHGLKSSSAWRRHLTIAAASVGPHPAM